MKCPNCGHAGQQVGISQTYECPGCGTVYHESARPQVPATSSHAAAAAVAELADVTRLAQIRQRAAQARLEKAQQAAANGPAVPRRGLRAAWVAVARLSFNISTEQSPRCIIWVTARIESLGGCAEGARALLRRLALGRTWLRGIPITPQGPQGQGP